jgi:hypothetical protein
LPPERLEVEKMAAPFAPSVTAPVPKVVVPSRNVTVPFGVPMAGARGVTVAVNVTDCPCAAGFAEELSATAALPLFTIWARAAEVAPAKLLSPA